MHNDKCSKEHVITANMFIIYTLILFVHHLLYQVLMYKRKQIHIANEFNTINVQCSSSCKIASDFQSFFTCNFSNIIDWNIFKSLFNYSTDTLHCIHFVAENQL